MRGEIYTFQIIPYNAETGEQFNSREYREIIYT